MYKDADTYSSLTGLGSSKPTEFLSSVERAVFIKVIIALRVEKNSPHSKLLIAPKNVEKLCRAVDTNPS